MDRIKKYVVAGRPLSVKRVFVWAFGAALLVMLAIVGALTYAARRIEPVLAEVPVIEIKNGSVEQPKETVWEKNFPDSGFTVRIDTRDSDAVATQGTGITLMRQRLVVRTPDEQGDFELPKEQLILDQAFWMHTLKTGIANVGILLGVMTLVSLMLGYWGTVGLTCLIGRLMGTLWTPEMIRRASAVGWIAVLILDIVLILTGNGFSVWAAMGFATVLSVLCLAYPIERQ